MNTEQKTTFLRAFAHVVEAGYSLLDQVNADPEWHADEESETDPDDVRLYLASAVQEAAEIVGVNADDPEEYGRLTDIIDEAWLGLAEYLALTTDR